MRKGKVDCLDEFDLAESRFRPPRWLDLPEQQQIDRTQNSDAAMEKATASQSKANMLVPSERVMSYGLKAVSKVPTTVEKMAVDDEAARMVNSVFAVDTMLVTQLPHRLHIASRPDKMLANVVQMAM